MRWLRCARAARCWVGRPATIRIVCYQRRAAQLRLLPAAGSNGPGALVPGLPAHLDELPEAADERDALQDRRVLAVELVGRDAAHDDGSQNQQRQSRERRARAEAQLLQHLLHLGRARWCGRDARDGRAAGVEPLQLRRTITSKPPHWQRCVMHRALFERHQGFNMGVESHGGAVGDGRWLISTRHKQRQQQRQGSLSAPASQTYCVRAVAAQAGSRCL
jgi:hypothetical protein